MSSIVPAPNPSPPAMRRPDNLQAWLWCRYCGRPLGPVQADEQLHTYLLVGMIRVYHAVIRCECGHEKTFVSVRAR